MHHDEMLLWKFCIIILRPRPAKLTSQTSSYCSYKIFVICQHFMLPYLERLWTAQNLFDKGEFRHRRLLDGWDAALKKQRKQTSDHSLKTFIFRRIMIAGRYKVFVICQHFMLDKLEFANGRGRKRFGLILLSVHFLEWHSTASKLVRSWPRNLHHKDKAAALRNWAYKRVITAPSVSKVACRCPLEWDADLKNLPHKYQTTACETYFLNSFFWITSILNHSTVQITSMYKSPMKQKLNYL